MEFKAEYRTKSGSRSAQATRRSEMIPAIIYGLGEEHKISVPFKEFSKEYFKGNIAAKTLTVNLDGKKITVVTRDIQLHPVTDKPIHVDFQQIDENKPIKVRIQFKVVGEQKCIGIKRGGVLNIVLRQAAFYCLPSHMKPSIDIDISNLRIGQSIHINDLLLPENIVPVSKSNFAILSIAGRADDAAEEAQET